MQPSAGSQGAPQRSYGRWRATVLANRDLLAGLLPTLALFIFSYGLACAQSHARARECSNTQDSLQGPDPWSAAEQCRPDPAGAALQAPVVVTRMLLNATNWLCPSGHEADSEEVATLSGSRQMLTVVARFMMLQVCTPLLRRHYESICGLLSLYAAVVMMLLRKRLYVVWRPVLLVVVRLLPLGAAAYIACSKSYPDLLLRLDECFMFYVKRPGTTHQMAARLTRLDAWQLQQLLLALGVCWQAVTLPLPPHVEGPVAATQGLLLVLIVGRISQALGMFGIPSFVAYWAACLLLCYVVPTWFSAQLDRRLRLRYRAWQTSVPSRGSSSEFEESEVQRHSSDTSTTSWWSATSKDDHCPWHLPGHDGDPSSSSSAAAHRRAGSSDSSSSSSRRGERSPSPVRPRGYLPMAAATRFAPASARAAPEAAFAAATSPWQAPGAAAATAGGVGSMRLVAEEEMLPDWTLPHGARSPSLDSAHDIHLSSQGLHLTAEQEDLHELHMSSHGAHPALQQAAHAEPHASSRAAEQQHHGASRGAAAAAAAAHTLIHPSSISLGPLPSVSSGGASMAVATPSASVGQGVPAAAQPTQVSSNTSTAPSITTVYMQLPGGGAAAPNAAAAAPSPFIGASSAALRAALAIPPALPQGDEDIGPATPSAAPVFCLRQGSRSSQASTGSSGATSASTAPGGSSGGSFSGTRPGPGVLQPPQGLGLEEGAAAAGGGGSGGRHRSALYTSRTQHMLLSAKVRFAGPAESGGELLQDPLPSAGAASSSSMGSMGSASSYPAHAQQVAAAAVAAVQGMFGPGTLASPLPEPGLLPVDSGGGSIESAGAQSCGATSIGSYIAGSAGDRLAPVSSYGQASSCDSIQIQTPPPYVPALAGLRAPAMALGGGSSSSSGGGLTRAASDGPVLLRVECVTFPGCVQLLLWGWCGGQPLQEEEGRGRRAGKQQLAMHLESKVAAGGTITAAAADVSVDGREDGNEEVVGSGDITLITGSPAAAEAAVTTSVMVEVSMATPGSGGWARVKGALLQLPGVVDVAGSCSDPHTWYHGDHDVMSSNLGLDAVSMAHHTRAHRSPRLVPTDSGDSSSSIVSSGRDSQALPHVAGAGSLVAVMAGGHHETHPPAAGGSTQGGSTQGDGGTSAAGGGGSGRGGASALHIMIDRPSRSSSGGSDTPGGAPGDEEGDDTPRWGRLGRLSGRSRGLQGSSNWLFQLQRHSPLVLLAHPDSQTVQLHLLLRPAPPVPASNPYLSTTPAEAVAGSSMVAISSSAASSSAAAELSEAALLPEVPQLVGRVGDVIVLLVKEGQVSSTWVWPEEQVLAALRHQLGDPGDDSGDASRQVDAVPGQGSDQHFTSPAAPGLHARTGAVTPEGYQFALELQLPLLEEAGVYHLVLAHQLPPSPEAPMAGLASPNGSTLGQAPSVAFARLPLAVLPPGCYQEVYQLLLPAMWDEAASDWHARRQQQQEEAAAVATSAAAAVVVVHPAPGGASSLEDHVQTVLWQHWCQLADDLGQVLQLGAALLPRWRLQQQAHLNDAELHLLQQLAPVVLSFFLGHGMEGCFFFALGMLPPPLQQSWLLLHQRRSHAALLQQQQLQLQQEQHQQQQGLLTAVAGSAGRSSNDADVDPDAAEAAAGTRDHMAEGGTPQASRPSLSLPLLDWQGHRGVTSGTSSSYNTAGASLSSSSGGGGGAPCSQPAAAFYDDSSMALTRMNTAAVAACEARTSLETNTPLPVSVACPERPGPLMSAPAQLTGAAERALLDACPDAAAHGVFAAAGARLGLLLGLPHVGGSFRGPGGSPLQGLAMPDSTPSVAGVNTPCGADPQRRGLWTQESLRSLWSMRSNSSGISRGGGGGGDGGPLVGRSSRPSSSRWDEAAAADAAAAAAAAPGSSAPPGGQPWLVEMEEEEDVEEQEAAAAGSAFGVMSPQAAAAAGQEAAAAAGGGDGDNTEGSLSPGDVVTWSTPFTGFQSPGLEELYVHHKHTTNLSADWGCAGFILVFMAALCLRLVWETDRWNTCGYILYLAFKLVAYVPLLAGRTEFFISHREALVVALSQGLCCLLIANKVLAEEVLGMPPLFMPPDGPLRAFWRVHGELLIYGLMMPFQTHLRMRWNVVYVLTEAAVLGYMFAHVFPVMRVVVRFGGAAVLSLVLAWWWDQQLRRKFLEGRHAKAVDSCAAAAAAAAPCASSSSSSAAAVSSSSAGKQKVL